MVVDTRGNLQGTPEGAAPGEKGAEAAPAPRRPLRVLIVEDSEDDADLVVLELRRLGYAPEAERVESRAGLEAALRRPWDLVICDYNLPSLDAPAALAAVRVRHADLPFLVVSGTTSEAQAVNTLLAGAQDFFQKGSLTRLGPAIERELKEAEGRRARRHAETALRRSEQRFQEVLENVSDLILLLSPAGEILFASPSCERILGFAAADLEGRRLAELAHPDVGALDALLAEARASGEAGRTRELVLARKDGAQVLLDVGAKDATAKGLGYILNARDITERRRTDKALALAEERLRAALLGSNAGTFKLDLAQRRLEGDASLANLLGAEGPEALPDADALLARVHAEDRDRLAAGLNEAMRTGRGLDEEFRLAAPGDAPRWIAVKGRAFPGADGAPGYMMGACVDITERRQALEQLRQSQKMEAIGRLAGGIAHDFNNLLTAINGYADLCLEMAEPAGPMHLPLEEIRKAGERAASLTQQLLAYSRRQVLVPKVVSLDDVVTDVERLLTRLIGEDIRIRAAFRDPGLLVRIDPGQMQQALVNLAVNARDAMPQGGEIRVETYLAELQAPERSYHGDVPPGTYAALRFADTGTGMPSEVVARVFEPFFTTKPVGKGTGLGLSMVYGMVRQSGGHVTVESVVGGGTTFTFYLPCAGKAAAADPDGPRAAAGRARNVLLVEDEASVLRFLSQVLESKGFQVHRAADAASALETATRGTPIDLLVTDVVMNGTSGPELWGMLRRTHPGLRVLFISGYTRDEGILAGWEKEADYLQKPFSAVQLFDKVESLLGKALRARIP